VGFTLLSFSGCKRNNIPNYPYNIGSKWVYSVYDSIMQRNYTETVEITGTTQLNNGTNVKVFKHTFSLNKDSATYLYLMENADTLTFLQDISGNYNLTDRRYVYPIIVGNQWLGVSNIDNYNVVSDEQVTVPSGNFNTFKITRNLSVTNYYLWETEWYSPSIGMIKLERREYDFGWTANKNYQLISYQLK